MAWRRMCRRACPLREAKAFADCHSLPARAGRLSVLHGRHPHGRLEDIAQLGGVYESRPQRNDEQFVVGFRQNVALARTPYTKALSPEIAPRPGRIHCTSGVMLSQGVA